MAELENEKSNLESQLNQPNLDLDKITDLSEAYQNLKDLIETSEMRWLELSEKDVD